jgi:hypothetical protein
MMRRSYLLAAGVAVVCAGTAVSVLFATQSPAAKAGAQPARAALGRPEPIPVAPVRCVTGSEFVFVASITKGPDAPEPDTGLELRGRFAVSVSASGAVTAALLQGSQWVDVRATYYTTGRIQYRFSTTSGMTVVAQGPVASGSVGCAALPLTGAITGPKAGDRGSWVIQSACGCDLTNARTVFVTETQRLTIARRPLQLLPLF